MGVLDLSKPLLAALLFLLALSTCCADSGSSSHRILVVKSRDIPFYNATLKGFLEGLQSRGELANRSFDIKVISLNGDTASDSALVKDQLSKSNDLIFTLGTDATTAVQQAHADAPCLFTMLVDPVSLGVAKSLSHPGENFTGTTLLVDPGKQLEALQQVSNQIKRIGVLYTENDATSSAFLATASSEAAKLGIQITAVGISDPAPDYHNVLEHLAANVDAFWLIIDPSSAGSQPLAETFHVAKEHKLPVLGMSNSNVKDGALLSLSANLTDLGDVDAEMACPLLDGTSTASDTPIRGPRQTTLSINLIAAKNLNITIPSAVLNLADEVIDQSTEAGDN